MEETRVALFGELGTQAYWSPITPPTSRIIVDGLSQSKSEPDLRVSA